MTISQQKVYAVVRGIPAGKVLTYSQVAKLSGINSPRAVGQILHRNTSPAVPCHRVVFADGSLSDAFAFGGRWEQRHRLEGEGIKFIRDRVTIPLVSSKAKETTLLFLKREDQILLACKKRGFGVGKWNGVGGKRTGAETIEETAVREAAEEILVIVPAAALDYRGVIKFRFRHQPDWNQDMSVFLAEDWQGEPLESEEMNPRWFQITALPYEKMWVDDRHWLPLVLAGKRIAAEFLFDETGMKILRKKIRLLPLDTR